MTRDIRSVNFNPSVRLYPKSENFTHPMATKQYSDLLKDPRWQKLRLRVFERDNFHCQLCDGHTTTLAVHHKRYIRGKKPWDYELNMLITLCEGCHSLFHKKESISPEPKQVIATELPIVGPNFFNHLIALFIKDISHKLELKGSPSSDSFRKCSHRINGDVLEIGFHEEDDYRLAFDESPWVNRFACYFFNNDYLKVNLLFTPELKEVTNA